MSWLGYHIVRSLGDLAKRELASPGARPDDEYLLPDERARQRACADLAADPEVDAGNIVVQVLSGTLSLSGTVPTAPMKARAAELCAKVPGVKSVEDALTVQ